jgi:hypothetical protein
MSAETTVNSYWKFLTCSRNVSGIFHYIAVFSPLNEIREKQEQPNFPIPGIGQQEIDSGRRF